MRPLWVVFGLALSVSAGAQPREDPRAISIHPFVGQRGTTFSATLRGSGLTGASAASLGNAPFTVAIEGVEPEPPGESAGRKTKVDLVKLRVEVRPDAKPGRYPVRLITRNGISNALSLEIVDGPVLGRACGRCMKPGIGDCGLRACPRSIPDASPAAARRITTRSTRTPARQSHSR